VTGGVVVIVPARYGAVRLPGKPLADVGGKPLIVRVLDGLAGCGADILVAATDDDRIAAAVKSAGYDSVMTGEAQNGTSRVGDAWARLGRPGSRIINVQGDEPLASASWVEALVSVPPEDDLVATLARRRGPEAGASASSVKVVLDSRGEALYFSRSPIPNGADSFLEHVGVYCFSPASLESCLAAPPSEASRFERLEQLAWMHSGMRMAVLEGEFDGTGIDTPEDLERVRRLFE
jgi:3-deoxy-manno-octulosonate cytidylyltransferase (CMP-KDO synthetase)